MNTNFKISLVIIAYNEEKYIGTCIEHALKSADGKFFEIIVVDNASTDKTVDIVKKYKEVTLVTETKKGITRARQRGLTESHGDILACIDADTRMPAGWVEQILKEFEKNQDVVCLSGPYEYYDVSWWKSVLIKIYWICAMPVYWITGYMVIGGNFAIKRYVLEKMNGFDTSIEFYGEDTNIARRAHEFGTVKFKLSFVMPTSGRRIIHSGLLKTAITYVSHFFYQTVKQKTVNQTYTDIR